MKPPEVDRIAGSRAAVAARRARAEVKRQVASGERTASDVLDAADAEHPAEASLRVSELIGSIPWLGPTRTARIMSELGISPSKRVGGLGVHQRKRLREFLVERQKRKIEPGALVVLAGPTAVGKGTVSTYIRDNHPEVLLSVSATTRPPRPGEVEGVNYYFVDDAEFDRMIEAGEFLEWATVHNAYRYGTPRPPITRALAEGKSVLLEIDIQGARQVRQVFPEARLVFLLPPSWEELVRRLTGRGTEDAEEQERRLRTAHDELAVQDEFDYRVVNVDVPTAAREVVDLMPTSPGY
ncbi:guanylate kinase [Naasia sp. SYSU D00057]|uniref:guanylate kinase n=1 Tax=Naasia sp. SYSU D00057 TaxID=2817380 RepID=UPI0027DE2342|nr:guanylate kinase [Naasia sp. SYSU D00057]